ncbi:MAG TPA: Flp family type IVb pilin [Allosphingosinicella sp.]|jgi:pilus assembly protein Flp/PilA|uniref:Flp family type IVb pilin n=1 Tax=Allosphingosinicella sp. TaxID=2823234 RepID=UPI002F2A3975
MLCLIRRLVQDDQGATAVEYALIAALVVISMVAALNNFASTTTSMWNNVSNEVRANT